MSNELVNVGVIGLGMMGQSHLDIYDKMDHVRVLAVADQDEDRLSGKAKAGGNIEGQAQGGFNLASPDVRKYREGLELIDDAEVDVIDVCVPTPGHLEVGRAAMQAGRHTLIEKPLARTYDQATQLADAAEQAWRDHQAVTMCAMCMRFWPGWTWLKEAVANRTFGQVRAATFRRVSAHPGGPFYSSGQMTGGALLDLHVHDADFIRYLFGEPQSVHTVGYSRITDQPDHLLTTYQFAADTPGLTDESIVSAEGGWAMSPGFDFSMRYTVNFEHATADFDLSRSTQPLMLTHDGRTTPIDLPEGMGYEHELAYFVDCVRKGQQATQVTLRDAAESVKLVESELAACRGK